MRILFSAVCLLMASPAFAQTMSNSDVISLLDAGLGEQAVIAKIETSDGDYDTQTETLVSLSKRGVPSGVIAAMVRANAAPAELSDSSPDPLVPHFTGVYLMDDWSASPRMWRINPTASTQTKTGGIFGYALTGGIASASVKAVIPGASAKTNAQSSRPIFYMYFGTPNDNQGGTFSTGFGSALESPNEFSLVKLKEKKKRREARVGSMNIAGAKAGVMDKDQIPFSYEQLAAGIFKVQPDADLEKGEYGFLIAAGGGVGPGLAGTAGAAGARVFDFSIE